MAALDSDAVRKALTTKLGCVEDSSGDHYRYILRDGTGHILGSTKISHGPKHTVGDALIPKMARQLNLGTSANFVAMVKCTKSGEECLAIIVTISSQTTRL